MIEVRFHGRGGQGSVVASRILASAFVRENKFGSAFPMFGFERRGAPVTAYGRFDDESVLEKAGVRLDQEGQPLEKGEMPEIEPTSEVKAEELEKLSPFRDVIEGLDLEDFEKK